MKSKIYLSPNVTQILKMFGTDIGTIILNYLTQCDDCKDLFVGKTYRCNICSPNLNLCKDCYELRSYQCAVFIRGRTAPPRCYICNELHCPKYTHWWDGYLDF
jgi:hypothetical protein